MKPLLRLTVLATLLASTSTFASDKITFQLDWLPGGDKAPVYVGVQEGFFAKEGLDVTIENGRGSAEAMTKIATGQSQFGTSDIGILMAEKAKETIPVVAVQSYFTKTPDAFFTLKGSGIHSVKDLKGKKIATSPFSSSNLFLPLVLKANGLKESDIDLIKSDPGTLGPMLVTQNTDAIIAWVTNTALYEELTHNAGKQLVEIPWSDSGYSIYSSSLLASEKYLKTHPDVSKRFIRAFSKATKFTFEHPDKAGEDLHKMVPEAEAKIVAAQIRGIHDLVYNDVTTRYGAGKFSPKRLAQTWKVVAKANNLKVTDLDPNTVVDFDYAAE